MEAPYTEQASGEEDKVTPSVPVFPAGTPSRVQSSGQLNSTTPTRDLDVELSNAEDAPQTKKKEKEAEDDPTLKALKGLLAPLTAQVQQLSLTAATKQDLSNLKSELKQEVTREVQKEVQKAVEPLQARLSALEQGGKQTGEGGTGSTAGVDALWRTVDRQDPAKHKVAFKGFKDNVSVTARLDALEELLQEKFGHLSCTRKDLQVVRTGPQQELTGVVLADVHTEKNARDFVKGLKDTTLKLAGCSVTAQAARTELNGTRNRLLRDAEKAVKGSGLAGDKQVGIKWGNDRQVTVGEDVAYQQNKWGVGGSFQGAFAAFSL